MLARFGILFGLVVLTVPPTNASALDSESLREILFPNQTRLIPYGDDHDAYSHRRTTDDVQCVTCAELDYCGVLNGYMIQEVYLPTQIAVRATCTVLEERAQRYLNTIFGEGRTFRDTDLCTDIVLQYLCLFWATDNDMYKNECINYEDYSDPDPANQKKTQRPPCRSFCVQLAELCANDQDFLQLCESIACPPTDEDCVPSPVLDGVLIVTDLACSIPFEADPYKRSTATVPSSQTAVVITFVALLAYWRIF